MTDIEKNTEINDDETTASDRGSQDGYAQDGYVELVYGTLMNPVTTFRKMLVSPPLFKSFAIYIAVLVIVTLTGTLMPQNSVMPSEYSAAMGEMGSFLAVFAILGNFFLWFLQGGIYQTFAELLGGTGRALTTLTVLALAEIPRLLLVPFQVLNYLLGESTIGTVLYTGLTIAFMIWSMVLVVIGLRETHSISTFRAAASVLAPIGISFLILILMLAGLIVFFYPLIGSIEGI